MKEPPDLKDSLKACGVRWSGFHQVSTQHAEVRLRVCQASIAFCFVTACKGGTALLQPST